METIVAKTFICQLLKCWCIDRSTKNAGLSKAYIIEEYDKHIWCTFRWSRHVNDVCFGICIGTMNLAFEFRRGQRQFIGQLPDTWFTITAGIFKICLLCHKNNFEDSMKWAH